jgi:hypothetical protein
MCVSIYIKADFDTFLNPDPFSFMSFRLKMYVHSPFDHIRVFMKAEGRKANSVRYDRL